MKIVSEDGTYIDYTTTRFGVRVREASCRAIVRDSNCWEEYGEEFRLPLTDFMIDPSRTECLSYDLSMNVADIGAAGSRAAQDESEELRAVLLGSISLNSVLDADRPCAARGRQQLTS